MFPIANCKNGVSSYEIGRDIKVAQRSAWCMLQRIRHAIHIGTFTKLSGQVEADETFIGGQGPQYAQGQANGKDVNWRSSISCVKRTAS
jgi:hypothetical protein